MQRYKDTWYEINQREKNKNSKATTTIVFVGVVFIIMLLLIALYISPQYKKTSENHDVLAHSDAAPISEETPAESEAGANNAVAVPYTESFDYIHAEAEIIETNGFLPANETADAPENKVITAGDEATSAGSEAEAPKSAPLPEGYAYGDPVPQNKEAAGDDYFAGSVFIGDSRTVGFSMHSGVKAVFWGHTGLNVNTGLSEKYISLGGEKTDVVSALAETEGIERIYISLGINEIGWYSSNLFIQKYAEFVTAVRDAVPDAAVYIQSILPMSKSASDTAYASQGGNDRIKLYNSLIKDMCAEISVHFVDVFEQFADENGYLPEDAGFDGVHLNPSYYKEWADYLKNHTIN